MSRSSKQRRRALRAAEQAAALNPAVAAQTATPQSTAAPVAAAPAADAATPASAAPAATARYDDPIGQDWSAARPNPGQNKRDGDFVDDWSFRRDRARPAASTADAATPAAPSAGAEQIRIPPADAGGDAPPRREPPQPRSLVPPRRALIGLAVAAAAIAALGLFSLYGGDDKPQDSGKKAPATPAAGATPAAPAVTPAAPAAGATPAVVAPGPTCVGCAPAPAASAQTTAPAVVSVPATGTNPGVNVEVTVNPVMKQTVNVDRHASVESVAKSGDGKKASPKKKTTITIYGDNDDVAVVQELPKHWQYTGLPCVNNNTGVAGKEVVISLPGTEVVKKCLSSHAKAKS